MITETIVGAKGPGSTLAATVGATLQCRMMCASAAAYGIAPVSGVYKPPQPYAEGVGYKAPPKVIASGPDDIDGALVGVGRDGLLVAFRGTLAPAENLPSILDWLQDFMAEPEAVPGLPGKVHRGFYQDLMKLWPGIQAAVQELDGSSPSLPLYVTGHSKGGPLASLAAALFQQQGRAVTGVYTYASPKPGDQAFATAYNTMIRQESYENYLDLVPFLVPSDAVIRLAAEIPGLGDLFKQAEGWNYVPVGNRFYIKSDGQLVPNSGLLDDLRIAEILGRFIELNYASLLAAHCHLCAGPGCAGGYMQGACQGDICR